MGDNMEYINSAQAPLPFTKRLPREIRDQIYRDTLVDDQVVALDHISNRAQPALLRVDKQIRKEAIKIYYGENNFHITVNDMKISSMYDFLVLQRNYTRLLQPNYTISVQGATSWLNLKQSMKLYHERRQLKFICENRAELSRISMRPERRALLMAMDVVNKFEAEPWTMVEKALDAFHDGLLVEGKAWQADAEESSSIEGGK